MLNKCYFIYLLFNKKIHDTIFDIITNKIINYFIYMFNYNLLRILVNQFIFSKSPSKKYVI